MEVAIAIPGGSQISDRDILSDADKSALDWVSKQLGSARIQRLIILVSGFSDTRWEADDLHEFISSQAKLACVAGQPSARTTGSSRKAHLLVPSAIGRV